MPGVSIVKVVEELSGFPAASVCVVNTTFERGEMQLTRSGRRNKAAKPNRTETDGFNGQPPLRKICRLFIVKTGL